ncbi:sugar ABC transporter permease [candidate division KSB1 bacterium]|nr:MAG: sugar ABC transporter permease [candidate division KSB1 bacterium]
MRKIKDSLKIAGFLLPSYSIFFVFIFFPLIYSFYLSFFHYSLLSYNAPRFTGLQNYITLLKDPIFWVSLKNTMTYTIGTVIPTMGIGLFMAIILNSKLKLKNFFRTAYFIPVVTSLVAASIIWSLILDSTDAGLVNSFLVQLGIPPQAWLSSSRWALFSVIIVNIWKNIGYVMIIYIAGLQSIPEQLYEAITIDGAGEWEKFYYITLPLLKPTTSFVFTTSLIGSFQVFTPVYIMTGGGPGYSSNTIVNYLYQQGFQNFRMGYASTIAYALFTILFVMTILQKKYLKAEEVLY